MTEVSPFSQRSLLDDNIYRLCEYCRLSENEFLVYCPRKDAGGFKSRIRPPYPKHVVKGD